MAAEVPKVSIPAVLALSKFCAMGAVRGLGTREPGVSVSPEATVGWLGPLLRGCSGASGDLHVSPFVSKIPETRTRGDWSPAHGCSAMWVTGALALVEPELMAERCSSCGGRDGVELSHSYGELTTPAGVAIEPCSARCRIPRPRACDCVGCAAFCCRYASTMRPSAHQVPFYFSTIRGISSGQTA